MNNVLFDLFKFATIQKTRIATGTDCTMLLGEIERLTTQVSDIQNALDDKDEELARVEKLRECLQSSCDVMAGEVKCLHLQLYTLQQENLALKDLTRQRTPR